jgi:hypothetical protein
VELLRGRVPAELITPVIVSEESNVLVNPAHPDMSRLAVEKVRRWLSDARFSTGLEAL